MDDKDGKSDTKDFTDKLKDAMDEMPFFNDKDDDKDGKSKFKMPFFDDDDKEKGDGFKMPSFF